MGTYLNLYFSLYCANHVFEKHEITYIFSRYVVYPNSSKIFVYVKLELVILDLKY